MIRAFAIDNQNAITHDTGRVFGIVDMNGQAGVAAFFSLTSMNGRGAGDRTPFGLTDMNGLGGTAPHG